MPTSFPERDMRRDPEFGLIMLRFECDGCGQRLRFECDDCGQCLNLQKELERLEQEVQNLEAELKNNGRLMNGMLQKVRQGRRKLESPERNTPKSNFFPGYFFFLPFFLFFFSFFRISSVL